MPRKFFFEVSALLDVRHCPKLQSCAISRKATDPAEVGEMSTRNIWELTGKK